MMQPVMGAEAFKCRPLGVRTVTTSTEARVCVHAYDLEPVVSVKVSYIHCCGRGPSLIKIKITPRLLREANVQC